MLFCFVLFFKEKLIKHIYVSESLWILILLTCLAAGVRNGPSFLLTLHPYPQLPAQLGVHRLRANGCPGYTGALSLVTGVIRSPTFPGVPTF